MSLKNKKLVTPFLKWVGGKRQIMDSLIAHLPKDIATRQYVEPFVGGGALLFHLQPKKAIANDFNAELVNVYRVIKNNLNDLIIDLAKHENTTEYFYKIRNIDRTQDYKKLSAIERASRIIYLNKTCFNGLYRVNNAGEFNVPFGNYKNPNIINEPILKAVNEYLNKSEVELLSGDYEIVLDKLGQNTFVYLDPPYHPISTNLNFTGYVQGGWNKYDQIRLKETCDKLNDKGIKFLQSNSSADLIKELYKNYNISIVKANRAINSDGTNRGEVNELLIKNY
ncbi:MAG: DNA adenine methylase [Planctomycetaceae bacterium]|jgi:DNA adenine methylase|nr:DNA adenine methylase [Planctomycetaceae bacterium]